MDAKKPQLYLTIDRQPPLKLIDTILNKMIDTIENPPKECTEDSCCCKCQHLIRINCHPGNQTIGVGRMSEKFGYCCMVFAKEEGGVFFEQGHGMCELFTANSNSESSPAIDELNRLLAIAKDRYLAWEKFIADGHWNREGWRPLYRSNNDGWTALQKAIEATLPVRLVAENGEIETIAATGILTADLMLLYDSQPDVRYLRYGYRLPSVREFLKVER